MKKFVFVCCTVPNCVVGGKLPISGFAGKKDCTCPRVGESCWVAPCRGLLSGHHPPAWYFGEDFIYLAV